MKISEQAKRLENDGQLDDAVVCYWKDEDGLWWVYLPYCGSGVISKHTTEEHDDGTISVTPSILMTGHNHGEPVTRHGYLTKGVWNEC